MDLQPVYIFILAFLGQLTQSQSGFYVPNLPPKQYVRSGDINLGGIFPINTFDKNLPCGSILRSTSILQYIEAMVFAVEQTNKRDDILPNVTLGFVILDDCKKPTTALSQALRFVANRNEEGQHVAEVSPLTTNFTETFDVVGVVGAMLSSTSISVADVLGVFHVPQVSYSSTSDQLSDKSRYPYFLRVVSPDGYQVRAMIELIRSFNWTYISTVHSLGSYGESAIKLLHQLAAENGICVAVSRYTDHYFNDVHYGNVMEDIVAHPQAKVVVLFVGPENAKGLMEAAVKFGAVGKFIWIGGDAWSTRLSTLGEFKNIALGAFTMKQFSRNVPEFDDYFQLLNPVNRANNPWFREFWEMQFGCSWSGVYPCQQSFSLINTSYLHLSSIGPVLDAVQTFAIALHNLIRNDCPTQSGTDARLCVKGPSLLSYLKNVSFEGTTGLVSFDSFGEFIGRYMIEQVQIESGVIIQRHVATWSADTDAISFGLHPIKWYVDNFISESNVSSNDIPESVCSKPCGPGEFYIQKELSCCWECRKCRNNEITTENSTSCMECPLSTWPEQTTVRACLSIEPTLLRWNDPSSVLLSILAGIGLFGSAAIMIFFILHHNTRLIKASSRELCYLMLCGIFLGYASVFGLIAPASSAIKCIVVHFGFTLGSTWIYAPLLTRTTRIYRIFFSGKKSKRRPPLTSSKAQIVIAASFIVIQVFISSVATCLEEPSPKLTMPVINEKFVELSCENPKYGLLAFLAYNLLLILLCSFLAFKTRKLPDNFNESRFISMCVYTTLVVWCAFIPTYFTTAREYQKTILLSLALIVNSTVALAFLYLPKVYAIHCLNGNPDSRSRRVATETAVTSVGASISVQHNTETTA